MYVPRHFAMPEHRTREVLAAATTAELVTAHETGPVATFLPVLFDASVGPHGSLQFHLMRPNSQWREPRLGEALAIVSGPDAYIAPEWFASYGVAPGVPTWNYVTLHAYGDLVVHDDFTWVRAVVTALSARYGYDLAGMPDAAVTRMLPAIVGVELVISRIEAKEKLSQNKASADVAGVIDGLREQGETEMAEAMDAIALPRALAKEEIVGAVRDRRRADRT